MGVYAVTGSASGMGLQVAQKLRDAGHTVIGVDIKQADIVADLSTADGRQAAAAGVLAAAGDTLDGAVLAAGLGPGPTAARARLIAQVNYFGVVDLLRAWRPALAAAGHAKVVVFSSNSTTTTPIVPARAVRAFLAGDADKAVRSVRLFGKNASVFAYAASKVAVSRWVRRAAVTPQWAGAGIRLNALAPGAIMTPLLEGRARVTERGEAHSFVPGPDRRIRRRGPARRLGDLHALGCRGLPMWECSFRRWRVGRILPCRRLAAAGAVVSTVVLLQAVQGPRRVRGGRLPTSSAASSQVPSKITRPNLRTVQCSRPARCSKSVSTLRRSSGSGTGKTCGSR